MRRLLSVVAVLCLGCSGLFGPPEPPDFVMLTHTPVRVDQVEPQLDGRVLVSRDDRHGVVVRRDTKTPIASVPWEASSGRITLAGEIWHVGKEGVEVWSADGTKAASIPIPIGERYVSAFARFGEGLVLALHDGEVLRLDPATRTVVETLRESLETNWLDVDVSADGSTLAMVQPGGRIDLLGADGYKADLSVGGAGLRDIALSPTGSHAVVTTDAAVLGLWDPRARSIEKVSEGASLQPDAVGWFPDGQSFLAWEERDLIQVDLKRQIVKRASPKLFGPGKLTMDSSGGFWVRRGHLSWPSLEAIAEVPETRGRGHRLPSDGALGGAR